MDYCSIFKHYHIICSILGLNYFRIRGIPFQRTFTFPLKWNLLIVLFYTSFIAIQLSHQLTIYNVGGIIEIPLRIASCCELVLLCSFIYENYYNRELQTTCIESLNKLQTSKDTISIKYLRRLTFLFVILNTVAMISAICFRVESNAKLSFKSLNWSKIWLESNHIFILFGMIQMLIKIIPLGLCFKRLNQDIESSESSLHFIDPLKAARHHYKLLMIGKDINNSYNIQLFIFTAYTFFWINFDVYTFIVLTEFLSSIFWHQVIWFFINLIRFFILVSACSWCSNQANKTSLIVHRVLINAKGYYLKELKLFSMQLIHSKFKMTACKLFNMDFTLLYSMIGSITTYLIILLQFSEKPSLSDLRQSCNCTKGD